jgi:Mce-associated membrane protein
MAGHADTADTELTDDSAAEEPAVEDSQSPEVDDEVTASDESAATTRGSLKLALVAAVMMVVAVAGVGGWLFYQNYHERQDEQDRDRFLAVGRQAAVNLTTIDFNDADVDVARIIDSATGTFLNDFQQRAQPFIDVVKQVKSKSQGTVTEAGLESVAGNEAQVMVALHVTTSTEGAPESPPRGWRMRINVEKSGDDFKVSNVQFVP